MSVLPARNARRAAAAAFGLAAVLVPRAPAAGTKPPVPPDAVDRGCPPERAQNGEVVDTLERNVGPAAADGFHMKNVLEPRVAAEFSAPLWCGCGNVKLRGGLHYRSPGTLAYDGPDPVLAQAFVPGSWQTVMTLGASIFGEYAEKGIRLDLDSLDVLHGPELSFGRVLRF